MIDDTEKDLLLSEMRLASVAATLNRSKDKTGSRAEAQQLEDCVRRVVEVANVLDDMLDVRRR